MAVSFARMGCAVALLKGLFVSRKETVAKGSVRHPVCHLPELDDAPSVLHLMMQRLPSQGLVADAYALVPQASTSGPGFFK